MVTAFALRLQSQELMPETVMVAALVMGLANGDSHDDALKRMMEMSMTQTIAAITKRTNRRQVQLAMLLLTMAMNDEDNHATNCDI